MEVDAGLKLALDGRALLFVGSGFSRGATNLSGDDFSLGSQLAATLSKEAGQPEVLALDDAAELFADRFGVDSLVNVLKSKYSAKTVRDYHKEIAAVPWRRVYTTNYDDVFELACNDIGRRVDSITPLDDNSQISKKNLVCVHLNGFIRTTNRDSMWNDLKLTQHSYDSGAPLDNDWGTLFRADLQAAQAVFFVGYSLYDLDVRRLLFEEQLVDKSFFVLGEKPDLATAHRAGKYGLLIAAGTAEFANQLANLRKTYVPQDSATPISFCLTPYETTVAPVSMEDRNVFDLLLYGRLRQDLLSASFLGQVKYCGPRRANELAVTKIKGGTKVVIFHSMLGNGKTVSLESTKYLAHMHGLKVLSLTKRGDLLAEELQNALVGPGKKIIFIDNYIEWLDVLPIFGALRSEDYSVVMSARSGVNDVLVDRVAEQMVTGDIIEIPLDKLTDEDLDWILRFFNEFGLWGDRAAFSYERKFAFLRDICHAEWREILLSVLESPQILDKLQQLFATLASGGIYRDALIRMLVLTVLAYMPDTPVLVDLCGDRILETGFRKDPAVQELVEFSSSSVAVRSSVTASVLLRQVVDPNVSVNSVIALITSADRSAHLSTYNYELFKNLVRYSNMQLVFPEKDKGRASMRVYEAVKQLPSCQRSPLFWLQYAIAALVARDFDRAKAYFENAYAFAKEKFDYDSFQIDNHYARYLLDRAVHEHNVRSAMPVFRGTRGLLFPQFVNERRHYPYRVAAHWGAFYSAFRDDLTDADKKEIRTAASYVCERIESLPLDRVDHRSVAECWKAMQLILADIEPKAAAPASSAGDPVNP